MLASVIFWCTFSLLGSDSEASVAPREAAHVQGVTISCQTWGIEWASPGFAEELEELAQLGANWVAIHPYARIRADGGVDGGRFSRGGSLQWLEEPIEEAHRRGLSILIKPHLAYWGSPFSWRGEIDFPEPEQRQRFFQEYQAWITEVARITHRADGFAVGTELDRLLDEGPWRNIIAAVRDETQAPLTYAANWTDYQRVPFWDALDAVGVQAYFPVAESSFPTREELRDGWNKVLEPLRRISLDTGKPVIFTELGYSLSLNAAQQPWDGARSPPGKVAEARDLQLICYRTAFEVLERERQWLRGAFLWKWFVGPAPWANFALDEPSVRQVMKEAWR